MGRLCLKCVVPYGPLCGPLSFDTLPSREGAGVRVELLIHDCPMRLQNILNWL